MGKYIKGIGFYIILAVVIVGIISMMNYSDSPKEIAFSELVNNINSGSVVDITIDENNVATSKYSTHNQITVCDIPSIGVLYEHCGEQIKKQVEEKTLVLKTPQPEVQPWWISMLPSLFLVLLLVGFWIFFIRSSQGGGAGKAMSFGKSRARKHDKNKKDVTFKDVAGADVEKEELKEIVEYLKEPSKFQSLGAKIPKGVLLVGPPGTGKTLLAKAVAGEAGVPFFSISGSDFVEMFVGVGASRVRDLFEEAKKEAPSIVFIDEIDAVGRQRGAGLGGGHDEREQTLNQLLVEMDGFSGNQSVVVIAATNRPDILDNALLRPGRFDRQVVVDAPDVKGREEILLVHAKNKPLAEDVDLAVTAKSTAGFTGADLANLLNEAALLAARRDKKVITMDEIEDAMIKVVAGTEKKTRTMSEKEKKLTAFHEAGHAVVSQMLPNKDPVHQISIIPRGRMGGYTMYLPTEDKHYGTKCEMLDEIVTLLGGRAAESITLDDISTGASNDIERASKIARRMVTKFGMSDKIGPISYGSDHDEVFIGRDFVQSKNVSESVSSEIDMEVRNIIDSCFERSKTILKENLDLLTRVATVLMEKEKISGDEFKAIVSGEDILADSTLSSNNQTVSDVSEADSNAVTEQ